MDLRLPPEAPLVVPIALVALALVALVQTLRLALRGRRLRRRLLQNAERGAWGEARAERLLERRGFRIVGRQVGARYDVVMDGEVVPVAVRADYVVDDGRGRYVAEVKSGELAPRIGTVATRRQLLEYCVAFQQLGASGVLLVDAEADLVRRVEFPFPGPRLAARGRALRWLLAGIAAGALAGIAARAF